jgi:hypothetical protein
MWSYLVPGALCTYSAHWDVRYVDAIDPPFVRILAYTMDTTRIEEHLNMSVKCNFYFENGRVQNVSGNIIRHLKADRSDNAFFILCPVKGILVDEQQGPFPVSVALDCRNCHDNVMLEV